MKTKKFALISVLLAAASAFAEKPGKKVQVDYVFHFNDVTICGGSQDVVAGASYRICNSPIRDKTYEIRLNASPVGDRQFDVAAEIVQLDSDGRIHLISYPKVRVQDGERAAVSTGITSEVTEMTVTARAL